MILFPHDWNFDVPGELELYFPWVLLIAGGIASIIGHYVALAPIWNDGAAYAVLIGLVWLLIATLVAKYRRITSR